MNIFARIIAMIPTQALMAIERAVNHELVHRPLDKRRLLARLHRAMSRKPPKY